MTRGQHRLPSQKTGCAEPFALAAVLLYYVLCERCRGTVPGSQRRPCCGVFVLTTRSEWQEFDGYKFRDLIVSQWGAAYDIQIKREMWLGKPMLFLNVMWKYLGQQSFHLSEQEYLEHLQALAELVVKWDRVDHLKEEIRKQRKRPNAYFGYAVALPLNLPADVMEELQKENEF